MRKFFLISVVGLSLNIQVFSQNVISVLCDDTWGPGRYNKITCTIIVTNSADFARFSQDFPIGLEVVNDNPGCGDFNWVNNQLILVWMKLPEKKVLTFSYFIKPDKSMNGNFTMTGRFITVSGRDLRQTTFMKEKLISIEGTNGILSEQMKTRSETPVVKLIKEPENKSIGQRGEILFRVQVSVSSKKVSEGMFKKQLGLGSDIGVKIIQTGMMYKYQVGTFPSYDSANRMLKQIIIKGYTDAFIVAYRDSEQIPVEKALNYTK
jgi:hypothetical protein